MMAPRQFRVPLGREEQEEGAPGAAGVPTDVTDGLGEGGGFGHHHPWEIDVVQRPGVEQKRRGRLIMSDGADT